MDGVLAAECVSRRLIIECSTIDAQSAREIGQVLEGAQQGLYINYPVSVRLYLLISSQPILFNITIGRSSRRHGRNPLFLNRSSSSRTHPRTIYTTLHNILGRMGSLGKFFYCGQRGDGLAAKSPVVTCPAASC